MPFPIAILVAGLLLADPPPTTNAVYEQAMQELSAAKTPEDRFYALNRAAKESIVVGRLDDARKFAQELLATLPKFQGDWNYGNAVQDAHLVLGRIAVRENRLDDAKRHLLESGKSPGSPQMDTFGPNMSLAEDLLKKGERQVVLDHFDRCRKFWKMEAGRLDKWTREVQENKIPNFGPNLLY